MRRRGAELDCTLEGTVSTRVAIQTTVVCTDAAGSSNTTNLTFYYDSRYDTDSSLALIAGNYTLPMNATGNSLSINGDGTLFGMYQNGPRCTLNGRVSIVDASFNLYRFEVLFSGCTVLTHFEGVTMTGFAARDLPGQKAGAFHLLLTAVVAGRLEFASVVYEPVCSTRINPPLTNGTTLNRRRDARSIAMSASMGTAKRSSRPASRS